METEQSVIFFEDYKELLNLAKKPVAKAKPVNKGIVAEKCQTVEPKSKPSEPLTNKMPLTVSQKQFSKRTTLSSTTNKRVICSTSTLNQNSHAGGHSTPLFPTKTAISLLSTMMENQLEQLNNDRSINALKTKSEKTWQRVDKIHGNTSDVSIYCDSQVNQVCDVAGICKLIRALEKRNLKKMITKQEQEESRKHKKLSIFSLPTSVLPVNSNLSSSPAAENQIEEQTDISSSDKIESENVNVLYQAEDSDKCTKVKKRDDPLTLLEMHGNNPSPSSSIQSCKFPQLLPEINMFEEPPLIKSPEELQVELDSLRTELSKFKHYNEIYARIKSLETYEHNLQEDIIRNQKILHDLTEERQKIEVEYLSIQEMVQTLELKCGNCKQLLLKKIQLEKQFSDLKHQMQKARRAKLKIKMEDKAVQHNAGREKCTIVLKSLRKGNTKCDILDNNCII